MYDDIELEKVRGLLCSLLVECEAVQKEFHNGLSNDDAAALLRAGERLNVAVSTIKEQLKPS